MLEPEIKQMIKQAGITDYRVCLENENYICDQYGSFYSLRGYFNRWDSKLIPINRVKKLKGSVDKDGYRTYRITVNGKKKHLKAHRMMLNAWMGPRADLVVNHKDGNKDNNALENLEWCTVAENNAHAIKNGFMPKHHKPEKYKIRTSEWIPIYILYKHCGYSLSQLGRINRCKHDTIKRIINRLDEIFPLEVLNG